PTPTPTQTPTALPTSSSCTMAATLLQDVTIPPGMLLEPGASFIKTWQVENSGSCRWEDYRLVFLNGNLLGGTSPTSIALVEPGATVELSLSLLAPGYQGTYEGIWRIQAANGRLFGPDLIYQIRIPQPTPTRTATLTPTSTPTSTFTPTRTATPTTTPIRTATPTPKHSATPTCTHTSTPTITPTPTGTITPTVRPSSEG
ncbi:MAG: NBR1-Ig-like domain-containing protein, partial [Anaerolineaceae bacterium]